MAKKKETAPTPLDRLTTLRKSVDSGHVMAELLDILIDAQGGDSEAVHQEIADDVAAGAGEESTDEVPPEE
jgi:hypothetical protein